MKSFKLFLISLLVISFIPLTMSADDGDSLYCYTQSSLKPEMLSLEELDKLTFSDDGIQVWEKQNEMQEISFEDFRLFTFSYLSIFDIVPFGLIHLGDVNNDHVVDISDVVALVNFILSGEVSTRFIELLNADINKDTDVDISDVVGIVNLVLEGKEDFYTCPDSHHPHLIDLGLPSGTKWACCNVGASSPEDYGGYYAWGETEEKDKYNWSTYIHCDGSYDTCHDLGSDIAGTGYDVAHVKWGGDWKMPTKEQRNELRNNCTYEWTTMNGVKGGKFTSKINGGSIFLPAAGNRWDSELYNAGDNGYYWSSTLFESNEDNAYYLYFSSNGVYWSNYRYFGRSVRPVR